MMELRNKERSVFVLGCFILACYLNSVESNEHTGHGNRINRFLFNKVDEPNTIYSSVTLCCTCNDFDKTNTCYEKCRNRGGSDLCFGKLCSTTATLLNGRFYLVSGCVSEDTCRQERAIYGKRPGCDTLDKGVVRNGTKCGYCCQSRDVITHGTEAARECRYNLDRMMEHVYDQNSIITGTTEPTVTSDSCQGNACSVSASHIGTSALPTKHSLEEICTSDAAHAGKIFFPYPDDDRRFIECDAHGKGYIFPCSTGLVWNDKQQACVYVSEM
ncbi:uncharacterized protein LOC123546643 [Mercenaria mercenaria]|uniref:uncharacterized protein LOC123546643 n=1 Tax=Mercenaria mercenaria TaxID=6596 RepID=UPI00234F7B7E|nr:uncharacterized protein LOC123546643 [Mercenaria mercenaria]